MELPALDPEKRSEENAWLIVHSATVFEAGWSEVNAIASHDHLELMDDLPALFMKRANLRKVQSDWLCICRLTLRIRPIGIESVFFMEPNHPDSSQKRLI